MSVAPNCPFHTASAPTTSRSADFKPCFSPELHAAFEVEQRGEEVFPNLHRFDIHGKNAPKQLTFGNGVHFCLRAPLARLELKITYEEFAKRFPEKRLSEPETAEHIHTFVFRAPDTLAVTLQ